MLKPISKKQSTESINNNYSLFNEIPSFKCNGEILLLNFQKGLIAEFPLRKGQLLENDISNLKDSGFLNLKCGLTPAEFSNELDIVLNATDSCNMACRYCFLNKEDEGGSYLDTALAQKFIKALLYESSAKDIFITFFGGEPSLHPKLINNITKYIHDIKQKFSNKQIHLALTSNGFISDSLLDFCINNNFQFTISMDGIPEIQNFQRPLKNGTSSVPVIEKAIKKITHNKNKLRIRLTVTEQSVEKMQASLKYLYELGAQMVHFECVNIAGRAAKAKSDISRPSAKRYIINLFECLDMAKKMNISIVSTSVGKIAFPARFMCEGASGHRLALSPNGFVSRCLEVQNEEHPLSEIMGITNFKTSEPCKTLLNNENNVLTTIKEASECSKCFCKWVCSNGCPSRNFHMTGDPFSVDPFYCYTTKHIVAKFIDRTIMETKERGIYKKIGSGKIWYIVYPSEFHVIPTHKTLYKPIVKAQIF